jgi:hypothetical protein
MKEFRMPMTIFKAEMDFDGLREDKVPPPGGIPRCPLMGEDIANPAGDKARRKKHLAISK